jgi:hypothetical protein
MNDNVLRLFEKEGNKAAEKATILGLTNPSVLRDILKCAGSEKKRIKNASAKCLREISRIAPEKLYSNFDYFVRLINSDDNILKWNAVYILGDLTDVDKGNKFNLKVLEQYLGLLYDKSMITAANTFRTLGKIALNKPHFRKKITSALLNVEFLPFSSECRNILAGTAIQAFELYIDELKDKKEILLFAQKHLKNRRNGTRKKAERFIKNYS